MYEDYWKLKDRPFRNVPDVKYFYLAPQYEDAFMKISYAILEDLGAVLVTGIFGCGKTLLLNYVEKELSSQRIKFVKVSNPQGDRIDILRNIVRQVVSQELPYNKNEIMTDYMFEIFEAQIKNNMRDGIKTIIIVDEAHLIKDEDVFEELRLFLNYQTDLGFEVGLILAGQPELKEKVSHFRHIEQRVALKAELQNLNKNDTEKYIKHRLHVAGSEGEIFLPKVFNIIYENSAGIPRRVNTICDLTLLKGMGFKKEKIDAELVNLIIKEFVKDANV